MPRPIAFAYRVKDFVKHIAGRSQQREIDYLREENAILRKKLGGRRIQLNDEERRRLAIRARHLHRKLLSQIATLARPDTLRRWYRRFVEGIRPRRDRPIGRPPKPPSLRELVVRMATENARWGCSRIEGELKQLGHAISDSTVGRILQSAGILPAPARSTTWREFMNAEFELLLATDFFTVDVWTWRGRITYYVLFTIDIATRAVRIEHVSRFPGARYMESVAREWVEPARGCLSGKRFLVLDRDKKFGQGFLRILREAGVTPMKIAPRTPNQNAYAERFVRSIKRECLSRVLLFSPRMLHHALRCYVAFYNHERPHQGIGNRLIDGPPPASTPVYRPIARDRLGGLLRSYHPAA